MPLYEYKCDNCGDVFELIQRFSDEPLTVHEKCGGPVHRLISTSALQFKGSGWYVNDYAKASKGDNGSTKPEGETKPAATETKTSSDGGTTSTTTTPAAKPTPSSTEKTS